MAASMPTQARNTVNTPRAATTAITTLNWRWRSLRRSSRQGRRFMRAMSVEAPEGQAAGDQERRRFGACELGLGAGRHLHLSEGVADHCRRAHLLADAFRG